MIWGACRCVLHRRVCSWVYFCRWNTETHAHMCTHVHTRAYMCTHVHTCAHMCTHVYIYMHAHMHMYTQIYTRAHVHKCACVRVCSRACVHAHVCTRAHGTHNMKYYTLNSQINHVMEMNENRTSKGVCVLNYLLI